MGTQIASLVTGVQEVKRSSNKLLYTPVGIYVVEEGYGRCQGKSDVPDLTPHPST